MRGSGVVYTHIPNIISVISVHGVVVMVRVSDSSARARGVGEKDVIFVAMRAFVVFIFAVVGASAIYLPPARDLSSKCLECEGAVKALDLVFGDADSVAALVAKIEAKCSSDICKKLIEGFVKIPEGIFTGMKNVAWPDWGLCAFINECSAPCCNEHSSPEQVHLSLAATDRSLMGVSWTTLSGNDSVVEWGTEGHRLTESAQGMVLTYDKAGWVGQIHRATMTGLLPGTRYFYRVGSVSSGKWSQTFSFATLEAKPSRPLRLAVIADMAYDTNSDNTVKRLTELAESGGIDGVVHSGDISYADGFQPHFDNFMRKVEPIASRVPYMVAPVSGVLMCARVCACLVCVSCSVCVRWNPNHPILIQISPRAITSSAGVSLPTRLAS